MNYNIIYMNTVNLLDACDNDYFKTMRLLDSKYQKGVFSNEEYSEMVDILSSFMMNGRI